MGRRLLTRLGIGLLVGWAWLSHQQIGTWASDRTLWTHAVGVSPDLTRPALNLAATFKDSSEAEQAVTWLVYAGQRIARSPRPEEMAVLVRAQLLWLTAFGHPACGRPDVRPYC